jgi:hypothetical protein
MLGLLALGALAAGGDAPGGPALLDAAGVSAWIDDFNRTDDEPHALTVPNQAWPQPSWWRNIPLLQLP